MKDVADIEYSRISGLCCQTQSKKHPRKDTFHCPTPHISRSQDLNHPFKFTFVSSTALVLHSGDFAMTRQCFVFLDAVTTCRGYWKFVLHIPTMTSYLLIISFYISRSAIPGCRQWQSPSAGHLLIAGCLLGLCHAVTLSRSVTASRARNEHGNAVSIVSRDVVCRQNAN